MATTCVGREETLATLADLLDSSRWVTLIGPPGSGKTLLARRTVAADPRAAWVDARGLTRCEDVLLACLEALGTEHAPGDTPAGLLSRAVDGTDVIVVIDGVDVDVTGLGTALQGVLEQTSGGKFLATSATLAGQPGERVVRVGPLSVPDEHEVLAGPAVDLFCARVEQAGGHPVDLVGSHAQVRRLLSATGGLPLLIEQIAVQCALVGLHAATPTHSLGEAVDTAYALLEPDQQCTFRRLGLLEHPVSVEVLAAVTGGDVAQASLVAAALVRRSLVELRPDGRFDMLPPIRARSRQLAGPQEAVETDRQLLGWADRAVPQHLNYGAADQPWLVELPVLRAAVLRSSADPHTRDLAFELANRMFSGLYTAMHTRDALDLMQGVLNSGDAPAEIGSMVARRAGIAASELHGTYEGLWLLERADDYASASESLDELAKTASIRAEMHLDAGDLARAEAEALRAIELDGPDGSIVRQATRTLADVHLGAGRLAECVAAANAAIPLTRANAERWITLSARTLLAQVALERGRVHEAVAATRAVVAEADELAESRVALLAETVLRGIDSTWSERPVDRDQLPWAVRLPVLAQDARMLFAAGSSRRAAGLAADVVALADAARLGRDSVEARLLLGRALLDGDEVEQATTTFLTALEQTCQMPMRLRGADALDGLASVARRQGLRTARDLAAAAQAIRLPQLARPWGYAAQFAVEPARAVPTGWVVDGALSSQGIADVTALFIGTAPSAPSELDALTAAERQVADLVADGLTSRQIGENLFVSPRTVDAHLTNIYRKLDINTRARLAAIVADNR